MLLHDVTNKTGDPEAHINIHRRSGEVLSVLDEMVAYNNLLDLCVTSACLLFLLPLSSLYRGAVFERLLYRSASASTTEQTPAGGVRVQMGLLMHLATEPRAAERGGKAARLSTYSALDRAPGVY